MNTRKPEIHVLRSRLQSECSDLRLLTDAELTECKWMTKKKVFIGLLSISPSLSEYHEEMLDILENRNIELNKNKGITLDRTVRQEEEMQFRTKYLRVVLSALTKLKWPPTLEAFSDPIDLLFNDINWVLNSFQYILDIAVPKSTGRYERVDSISAIQHSNSNSPEREPQNSSHHQTHFDHNSLEINSNSSKRPPKTPSFGASSIEVTHGVSALDISELSVNSNHFVDTSRQTPTHSRDGKQKELPPRPSSASRRQQSSASSVQSSVPSHQQHHYSAPPDTGRSVRSNTSVRSTKSSYGLNGTLQAHNPVRQEFGLKAFEILQTQNESLRKKLALITAAMESRDQAENKFSAIITDLKMTVKDLAEMGGAAGQHSSKNNSSRNEDDFSISAYLNSNSNVATTNAVGVKTPGKGRHSTAGSKQSASATDSGTLKESELSLFEQEVAQEQARLLANKNKTMGLHSVVETPIDASALFCSNCKAGLKSSNGSQKAPTPRQELSSSSAVVWSKLLGKVTAVEAQWTEANRAVRAHMSSPVKLHPSTQQYVRATATSPHKYNSADESFPYGWSSSPPSSAVVRQALGVQRQAATLETSDAENYAHGLDVSRVHQLQRDLVHFAEYAFSYVTKEFPLNGNDDEYGDFAADQPKPTLESQASKRTALINLEHSAYELLLHLSCLAPIAPLAVDSPYRSSMTGLDLLISETSSIVGSQQGSKANRNVVLRLQALTDRAKSEQVALVRCLQASRSALGQWCEYSHKVVPKLNTLGAKHTHHINKALTEIEKLTSAVNNVQDAFQAAEQSRIAKADLANSLVAGNTTARSETGGVSGTESRAGSVHISSSASVSSVNTLSSRRSVTNQAVLVSPLDALMRGSAGVEVAALVQCLRMHREELVELPLRLEGLGLKLRGELKADTELITCVKNNYEDARVASEKHMRTDPQQNTDDSSSYVNSTNSSSRNRTEAVKRSTGGSRSSALRTQSSGGVGSGRGASGAGNRGGSGVSEQHKPSWDSGTAVSYNSPPKPPFNF